MHTGPVNRERGAIQPSLIRVQRGGTRRMPRDDSYRVVIDNVLYRSSDTRFSVVAARDEQADAELILVGDLGAVSPGETLQVQGKWQTHPQHGRRFAVESFSPITPQTPAGIARYLGSGLIEGVGPSLAQRLVERFGDQTLEVISTQSARLREVSGIGPRRANAIAEAVRARRAEADTLAFLQSLGLGPALSKRILRRYGTDTVRAVRDDPYLVAEEVAGVGFRTADRIGRALGYALDDPRRAAGALLYLLGEASDDGHVYLPRERLLEGTGELQVPGPAAERALNELLGRGLAVEEQQRVYPPPLHRAEVRVARVLHRLGAPRPASPAAASAVEQACPAHFAEGQRRAVAASFEHGLLVITGGPGTGKTTTVRALVQAHHALSSRVALCAPTGRAAKRLSEATGRDALTIHRLLEYMPRTGEYTRNAHDPLDADLVLVDEASMLDLLLADKLLDALRPGTTLVLVGDVDQLPPVGAGPVLRDVLGSGTCPVVRLTQVFRQAQLSAIVRGAHDILHDRLPTPTPSGAKGDGDLYVIRAREAEQIQARLVESLRRMPLAYGLDVLNDVQVVTPMRRGPVGTEQLNALLQQELNPDGRRGPRGLRIGDKVMQLRNDYDREVFNGDVGVVRGAERDSLLVDVGGRMVSYEGDAIDALTLAYACTVHKVQGSEFPAVVVLLHGTHHILLSRPLLYTAVTRARRLAVIIGDERALKRAISTTELQTTYSHLRQRLVEAAPLAPR
jgi:exodeoxyribonuclease V alpha subunit